MDAKEIYPHLEVAHSFPVGGLRISFTSSLADKLQDDDALGKKFCDALRHGFVGVSRGGKPGITVIIEND